jgi:ubiquinone/menaquinone biosynthesis C-methylase UbiE
MSDPATERVRHLYDERLAEHYDRRVGFFERILFGDGRSWVCSQAEGDVLEIAVGTGRNLPFYPPEIRLTGIELSEAMLEVARHRARELGREVELQRGDAQALDLPADRFDSVVCTLSLCTIPDDRAAVREAKRVLRPGGRLLLLEHVRSPSPLVRGGQRLLNPLFVRLQADHLLREPLEHLRAEDFAIDRLERSTWGIVERVVARKG